MKRILSNYALTSIFILLFFACTDLISEETQEINVDPEVASQLIEDLYAQLYTPGSAGTNSNFAYVDFGQKTYDLLSDLLTGDMAISQLAFNSGGLTPSSYNNDFGTTDYTYPNNHRVWNQYYNTIEIANTIISLFEDDDEDPVNEENRHLLGQALAMRAHSYFYLTQFMANDFDPFASILPIYLEPNSDYAVKSTTAEVFQLIESDLNRAIDLLENYQRPSKLHVNKYVAQAILAYAVAAQRDVSRLNEVITLCDEITANSGAVIMNETEVIGGFNNIETPGWIWGVDLTYDMNIGLLSWWGQVDFFSYSWAWAADRKAIDQNFYNSIPENDVRKSQFNDEIGQYFLMPLNKFYDSNRVAGGTNELTESDYVFMRISEMYLLKAESYAKLGQDTAARMALAEVLSQRLSDITYLNTLSGEVLQDEIYLQTRIEFWGEGKTYLALKRNERPTVIRGDNHVYSELVGTSYLHNDERMTFEIPQSEIENNPFINEQN